MKCIVRIVEQPDMMVEGSFEDIVMVGATAASALCCKDRPIVRFYVLDGGTSILMYQDSVSHVQ